jgi:hypothetical protein
MAHSCHIDAFCTECAEHVADISQLVDAKLKLEAEVSELRANNALVRPVIAAARAWYAEDVVTRTAAEAELWIALAKLEEQLFDRERRELEADERRAAEEG